MRKDMRSQENVGIWKVTITKGILKSHTEISCYRNLIKAPIAIFSKKRQRQVQRHRARHKVQREYKLRVSISPSAQRSRSFVDEREERLQETEVMGDTMRTWPTDLTKQGSSGFKETERECMGPACLHKVLSVHLMAVSLGLLRGPKQQNWVVF